MTTIVYRDGVLAADGRATAGAVIVGASARKVFRLSNGGLAAGTGNWSIIQKFVTWLNTDRSDQAPSLLTQDKEQSASHVLEITPRRRLILHEPEGPHPVSEPFVAMGSGKETALGALHMGADALSAVKIACLVDPYSGGEIYFEKMDL